MKPFPVLACLLFTLSLSAADAPKLLLAKTWNESFDPTGWWISEKHDGMRGFWDGRALWTRSGIPIHAPKYFLAELPKGIALDGELWLGRSHWSVAQSTQPARAASKPNPHAGRNESHGDRPAGSQFL